jgi:acyl-CoA thioesterase
MGESLDKLFEVEPYARKLGMRLLEVGLGMAMVEMRITKDMNNIFGSAHGAAIYALMDVAFELAANSHGTVSVALDVNVNYLYPAVAGDLLIASVREMSRSPKISTYFIEVKKEDGRLVATAQAMAYNKKDPLPSQ